jgi:hypothetical protein
MQGNSALGGQLLKRGSLLGLNSWQASFSGGNELAGHFHETTLSSSLACS